MKRFLIALLAITADSLAATTIEVTAKFADVPSGVEVPDRPESLAKARGIDILSAPRVTTAPSKAATIEVTQNQAAPDGSVVPLGITLTITPTLTEKGNIAFKGRATDRFKHGQRESESLSVLAFVAREIYFKGTAASGSTVVLKGGPATSAAARKDPSVQPKSRELVIWLTFKKVVTDVEKKKPASPAKTTKSSGTKTSGKGSSNTKSSKSSSTTKKKTSTN